MEVSRSQAVKLGKKVYIGGAGPESAGNHRQVFQYNLASDEWSRLPLHHVLCFAMAQFTGNLITVGGIPFSFTGMLRGIATGLLKRDVVQGLVTGKVYRFKEESQKWEEFLKPMPTARLCPSVATTQSAIVASGGVTDLRQHVPSAAVEVYNSETSQWHTADPLPVPRRNMTSVTIAGTLYQLGGYDANKQRIHTVLCARLTTLIVKATSPALQSANRISVWKTLPDTPLVESAAASLSGSLLAVGGWDDKNPVSPAVHVFLPLTNSWVRVTTGDIPEPRYDCTAVQLSSNQLLVVGGYDNHRKYTKTAFLGSIAI